MCDEVSPIFEIQRKPGIFVVVVLAKTMASWLAESGKLIDPQNRRVMQIRLFYGHGSKRYRNVNVEPLTAENAKPLECNADRTPKPGQERFLVITTPDSNKLLQDDLS